MNIPYVVLASKIMVRQTVSPLNILTDFDYLIWFHYIQMTKEDKSEDSNKNVSYGLLVGAVVAQHVVSSKKEQIV